ncbi:MAG: GAF domain-containing protein [Proteobacteria bacterium]|nr:GAF domain-containing protein [Pseudomonadota bacterium]
MSASQGTFDVALSPLKLFEIDFDLLDTQAERIKRIRWIIRLRFGISLGVVALMFFTGWRGLTRQAVLSESTVLAVAATAAVAMLLNLAYQIALRRELNLKAFVILQLVIDLLIFSSYVYRTGGVISPFTFLFLLPIIAGAMLISGPAAFGLASGATLCFATMTVLDTLGIIDHVSYFVDLDVFVKKWSYVSLMLIVHPFAFFTTAALSAFLMGTVRNKTESLTETTLALDRQAHRLNMFYQASRSAVAARDQDQVIDTIGRILVEGLNLDRVLIYLLDPAGHQLVLAREYYHPRYKGQVDRSGLDVEIDLRSEAGVTARCALTRQAENVPDPAGHPLINQGLAQKIGLNPFAVAPMVSHNELIGVLGVDRKFADGVIGDDDFQVLIAFADQAATALRTARLERAAGRVSPK